MKILICKFCKKKIQYHNSCITNQSQEHGFKFENIIREDVFDLPVEKNNIDIHDIPKKKNKYNNNENCSIKTTCGTTIYCSDIQRFYNYNFEEKNTIIVVKCKQLQNIKKIIKIYEINYNAECHRYLFGNLTKKIIEDYVKNVKSIPKNINNKNAKKHFDYLVEKKNLETNYKCKIQINPKIDSKEQRRVQCSITNFETILKKFIIYESSIECPNLLRGKKIKKIIESPKRKRNKKI